MLNLLVTRNTKISPRRISCNFALQTVSHSQFVGMFIIYLRTKIPILDINKY